MQVIDNYLPEEIFKPIQTMILSDGFPWYWNDAKSTYENYSCNDLDNFQLTHRFYDQYSKCSTANIDQIIVKLNPQVIVRIKANLNPKTTKIIKYGFHVDTLINCKTAIYYLNTNNGYTEFKNGERVESVENRMVFFESQLEHTGTSCTNQKRRVVINFNYF